MMQAFSWGCCGWWKGMSQDEVTLISEEIKPVAIAIIGKKKKAIIGLT